MPFFLVHRDASILGVYILPADWWRHFRLLPSSQFLLKMWFYEQNLILDIHLALGTSHQWTWRSCLTKTGPWQKCAADLKSLFDSEFINTENEERYLLFLSETYFLRDNDKTEPAWTHNHQIKKLEIDTGKCSSGAFHLVFRGRRLSCLSFRVCFFFLFYSTGENCSRLGNQRFLLVLINSELLRPGKCGGCREGEGELPGRDAVLWRGPTAQSDRDESCASFIVLGISLFGSHLTDRTKKY